MRNKPPVILVDMDDVLVNTLERWVYELDRNYHLNYTCEDVTTWNMTKVFAGLTPTQIYSVLDDEHFWWMVRPKKDAARYMQKLIQEGYEIYVCTSSDYKHVKAKLDYALFRHFPFLRERDVIITAYKQLIDADILVDDGVHNLICGNYKKLLMDAPHNRQYHEYANDMERVHNWAEIYEQIHKLCPIKQNEGKEINGDYIIQHRVSKM